MADTRKRGVCTLLRCKLRTTRRKTAKFNLREPRARLAKVDQDYADARLALGTRSGGVALARCEQSIIGAYLGGVVDLARTLARHSPTFRIEKLLPDANELYRDVCDRGKRVKPDSKVIIYNDIGELAEKRAGKAVHYAITKILDAEIFKELVAKHGNTPRTAHLINSQGKAAAALLAAPRWVATRIGNSAFRAGLAAQLGLPQTAHGVTNTCSCGATNPATGEHAYLCAHDTRRQVQATAGQNALGLVVECLPRVRLIGTRVVTANQRPAEPQFAEAVDTVGIKLYAAADGARRFDAGFRAPDGEAHYVDVKRTALVKTDNLAKVCDVKRGQGYAAKEGDEAKIASYRKAISNLDSVAGRIHFATVDTAGNLSDGFDKLIKMLGRMAYPGAGVDGRYDVDGLRSRAVAFARQTVAAGLWRSNYITISAWADRTYGRVTARVPPTYTAAGAGGTQSGSVPALLHFTLKAHRTIRAHTARLFARLRFFSLS